MAQRDTVIIASRAIALYLIFWATGNLVGVPALIFSLLHYAFQPGGGANYFYKLDVISLTSHLVFSSSLFLAANWTYRCGPRLQSFLAPPESDQQEPEV